ncbi:hypothetical protein [Limosilactobacillus reuteri]|uniref:Uncharacterized protein n=1 Tax=Limosilactobacillus reuteri TaxID=1598 RepID=A0AB36ACD0_LIMRT|nr:hypothetical protein [Limosilactobacillus reuteri]MCH5357341.1 hypothetical protein [Limosilactobacillus reuteri]MRG82833.1 hypothetical protein [Limosilactobacillus reuteri]
MILTQEQIIPLLNKLLQAACQDHQKHFLLAQNQVTQEQLIQLEHSCRELTIITHDLQLLMSLPTDTTYYIKWQINLQETELPDISLNIRPVTPNSHYPLRVSPQLTDLFIDYFVKVDRIPNPWLIS